MMTEQKQVIPEGYKQTEIGVYPCDWCISILGDITDSARPISYGIVQTGPSVHNGIKCIRVVDINNGIINAQDLITTSSLISSSYRRTVLKEGDLVIPLRGKVGEVAIIPKDLASSNLTRGVALIALLQNLDGRYIKYFLSSPQSINRFIASMNGSALQEITIATLRNFKVAVPSLQEQTAIANALSDVDALISELEKLIAKKQAIKTATMQQLLTGKTRLPEFALREDGTPKGYKQSELGEIPEDWGCCSLGELCSLKSGLGITSQSIDDSSDYRCYGGNGLRGYTHSFTHDGEFVLIGRQGALCGNIQYVTGRFFASEHALVASPLRAVSTKWLAIYLDRMNLNQYSESSAQPGLSAEKLRVLKLLTPTIEEQKNIAVLLFEIDNEIQSIQQRLDKTRQIKQGMMQELLTGKTRLVKPEGSVNA